MGTPIPTLPIKPDDPPATPALSGGHAARLDGACFAYTRGLPVVQEVTAGLAPGRVTALVGPNGAGKSTLLRLLLGELAPTAGRVEVAGRDPRGRRADERARCVSYVPQGEGGDVAFTVREAVAMGRFAYGDLAYIDDAIQRFDLASVAGRAVTRLSGGQRQRVRLARAWAQSRGPDQLVVLADEPVAALDLKHAHGLMAELRELAGEGRAVLVVLHDLALAARYADDAWLMDAGRLVAAGPADQVLEPAVLGAVYGLPLSAVQTPAGRVFFPSA